MKKRLSILSILLILVLTMMTACGSGKETSDTENTGTESTDTETSDTEDTETALEETPSDSGELTPINVAVMTNAPTHWSAVIGLEKGIFEENGLELSYAEFPVGINTIDAVVTGQSDIGMLADYAAVNRIGNTSSETDLKIISTNAYSSTSKLYVNPEVVTELSDLAGQGCVTNVGTVFDYWWARLFEQEGIAEEDRKMLSVDSDANGVAIMDSGEAVAMWAAGTTASKLEEYGMIPIIGLSDIGLSTYAFYLSTDAYLSENQETIGKFLRATQAVYDYIKENLDEAASIVESKIGIPEDQFIASVNSYHLGIEFAPEGLKQLNDIESWAFENGRFDVEFKPEDFIDTTALENVLPDKVTYK